MRAEGSGSEIGGGVVLLAVPCPGGRHRSPARQSNGPARTRVRAARALQWGMYQEQCTQKEIGVRLGLSVRSVEGHLRRVRLLARDMQRRGQIDVPFAVLDSKVGAR